MAPGLCAVVDLTPGAGSDPGAPCCRFGGGVSAFLHAYLVAGSNAHVIMCRASGCELQRVSWLRLEEGTVSPKEGLARVAAIVDVIALAVVAQTLVLGLSLDDHIGWSWQWVALPLW